MIIMEKYILKGKNMQNKKYKLYINNHGWVIGYDRRVKMSGKRYCFDMGYKKDAIKLTFLEALDCMNDCNDNYYNNWSYKIDNEKEFLKDYENFKKNNAKELDRYNHIDKENPLIHHKKIKETEWACIQRLTFCKAGIFGEPEEITWYYSLTTDSSHYTSGIIGFKKVNDVYEFETFNSIYKTKKMLDIKHMDQIKELENYFASDSFKEFMDMEKEHQKQEIER